MKSKPETALREAQKKAQNGGTCDKCQGSFPVLNVDHIVGVGLLSMIGVQTEGGLEDSENLELICRRCNVIKGNKLDFNNPKTFPLLRKYVDLSESLYKV